MKQHLSIEIVSSNETRLSSMSQLSRESIFNVLKNSFTDVRITIVDNSADLEELCLRNPDLVFLGMKYILETPSLGERKSKKIWVSDYLEERGIAYTGSPALAHRLEHNKSLAKQCVIEAGLNTSPFFVAKNGNANLAHNNGLNFPVFIKPTDRGGGLGIDCDSVAHSHSAMVEKINSIYVNFQSDSIVEEFLPGREFSVAILGNIYNDEFDLMPLELIAPEDEYGDRILSAEVKSADTETFAEVEEGILRKEITTLAIDVFRALGAKDYGRVDIRIDKTGKPQFLEANLIPSLIRNYGNFPKACKLNLGLQYEEMILKIVELGLNKMIVEQDDLLEPDFTSEVPIPLAV